MDHRTDPFTTAIERAVDRAMERYVARIIDAMPLPVAPPAAPVTGPEKDRLVSVTEAAEIVGCHRTTLLKYEHFKRIAPRRFLPGGKSGWLLSEIRAFLDALPPARAGSADKTPTAS